MSEIKLYYLGAAYPQNVKRIARDNSYTIKIHEEGEGILRFSLTPNLTTGHKTAMQKMLDAIGYGTITP